MCCVKPLAGTRKCLIGLPVGTDPRLTAHHGVKEGNILFNKALNTFCLVFIWCRIYRKGPLITKKKPAEKTFSDYHQGIFWNPYPYMIPMIVMCSQQQ